MSDHFPFDHRIRRTLLRVLETLADWVDPDPKVEVITLSTADAKEFLNYMEDPPSPPDSLFEQTWDEATAHHMKKKELGDE